MAKYEISHPELPQVRGILELPDGVQPSEKHFWEAAKTQVRPYGASQLSDKAKIIAFRNGFFDTPSMPILDQEDDPSTLQSEETPGILSNLFDMGKEGLRRIATGSSPHEKVNLLGSKLDIYNSKISAQDYASDKFAEQFKEAGKITFGNLDNMVAIHRLDDVVARSLRQVGLKPTKSNRAKAIKAARDYSEGNIIASTGQGAVRALQTSTFVAKGVPYLTNKMLMDEADDSDVLDFVNSAISFDKLMYENENADKLAVFVMDNPLESIKTISSGIVGGVAQTTPIGAAMGVDSETIQSAISDKDSLSFDSKLLQDLRTGYQEPSEGLSLLTEVAADPLNLAGAPVAKGVTAPLRIGLKGQMVKTLEGVRQNTTRLAQLQTILKKLPEDALVRGRIEGQAAKVAEELAEQQKVLQKYGSNSLALRLAGQASPETLGKVAMETFDQSTEVGKLGMGLVREATKATDEMSKLRRVANVAAKYNPEIAGATVGAMIAGPGGAVIGASLPTAIKVARFVLSVPENFALRLIITAAQNAGEEITEQAARQKLRNLKALLGGGAFGVSGLGYSMDFDALADTVGITGLATILGPKSLSLFDNIARDARVIGSELTLARTGDHTPFFRRLAMLPTPDQGLAGATTDKFNILMRPGPEGRIARAGDALVQGARLTAREVSPPPQAFRRGPQGEAIGRAPTISGATQRVADFLDKPGVAGRLGTPIETLGRFGKGMAAGASIPTTIGFVASGGQPAGAVAGGVMSAPFTALGAGAGMYQNYKTKGDLYAKQIGDVQYYREHLTKSERAEFDALPANIRAEIAGYSLSHPDVVFKQTTEGEGGFNPVTMEVTYNPNGTGYLKGTMAHEITHFMEVHGLTPMVNRILFGDEATRTPGEFASYDSDGKIVYTDEFKQLRDIYMDRLRKDTSLDPEAVAEYESDPQKIGREIFADQGADYLLSGKREKALNQGPLGKFVGATIDGITGVSFLRDFLLKLNLPLNSEGKFITSTDLFKGKLRKIPELQNLIEKYYKDVRALNKAQIEGEKITDPSGRTIEKKGARPIDDEFDTLYTVEDQKDPNIVDKLDTGGIFKTDPKTGKPMRDALQNPIRMTKGEADKVSKAAGDHAAKVFERNGIEVEKNDKGQPFAKDVGALNEDIIDQLAKGPIHPRQIAALREISRALRQGDGERAGMLIGYYSASTGRKPKAVPFKLRTTMPYGFELTAQGNILVRLHDTQQIQRNLKFLKGELQPKKLPDELIGMYDDLFGNDNAVWDAFATYRNNTSNGIDGRTGLDSDPVRANQKLNFLNALHGAFDKAHVAKNPVLSAIGYKRASSNNKREPFGTATRTFRLDRIFDAKRSGTASGFNLERAKNLMSPQGQKLLMPQMELDFNPPKAAQSLEAKPNFWKIYRIDPKGPRVYDEVADVLIQVGSPWMDGSIIESQAPLLGLDKGKLRQAMNRAHRRAERGGGKQFMPAAYHGTPHTFKAEEGAPLGRFRTSAIGTGEGAQAYGHGLYFAGKREVADYYRSELTKDQGVIAEAGIKPSARLLVQLESMRKDKVSAKDMRNELEYLRDDLTDLEIKEFDRYINYVEKNGHPKDKGSLYKVELAPKENEYLYWDKPLSEQPKGVREKLAKVPLERVGLEVEASPYDFGTAYFLKKIDGGIIGRVDSSAKTLADIKNLSVGNWMDAVGKTPQTSAALKEAGIPGIKYLDGDSRAKGKGDYNYVIFDEADVQITEKLFMPASEAGASKGKLAEAAKLWNKDGVKSPYFKKWFGKSKVVDENGDPLVVYHGTDREFTSFDPKQIGSQFDGYDKIGFFFTTDKFQAEGFAHGFMAAEGLEPKNPKGRVLEAYLNIEKPLTGDIVEKITKDPIDKDIYGGFYYEKHKAVIEDLMSSGKYDGLNIGDLFVATKPEQIKSATGNRGTFDAGESNILFMPASGDKLTATHNLSAEALAKADELGGLPVPSVGITKGRALEGFGEVTLLGTRPLVDPELGVPAFGSDVYSKRFPREKYKPVKMKKADEFFAKYKSFAEQADGSHELSLVFDSLVNSPDLGDAKWRFISSDFAKMAFLEDKGKRLRVPKKKESTDPIIDRQLVDEVSKLAPYYENIRVNEPEWVGYSELLKKAFDRSEMAKKDKVVKDLMLDSLFDENNLARAGVGDRILREIRKYGNTVIDKIKLRDRIENKFTRKLKAEYERWATQEVASLFDEPYIIVDRKKVPLTLETATDAMVGRIRATEKNMTFGPGEARSMGSPKMSSIQEMRNRSDAITSKKQFDQYKETVQDPIHEAFRESAMNAYKYSDTWTSLDLSYRALGTYLQSTKGTKSQRMRSALRKFDFEPNDELVNKAIKAAEVLRDAPTEYFEAKPQRAVMLKEFVGAIIPKNAGPKVKQLADKYGWEVKTYDSNKPETRQTAVKQLANRLQKQGKEVLFMPSDPKAPKRQPVNRVQQQARSMPANRFMAPASMAKGELSERFR